LALSLHEGRINIVSVNDRIDFENLVHMHEKFKMWNDKKPDD